MTILFRPQGAFGWFSYTTSRDTIPECLWSQTAKPDRLPSMHDGYLPSGQGCCAPLLYWRQG